MLDGEEKADFERVLRRNRCHGARLRLWAGMLELYALPDGRQFPAGVEGWLLGRGFVRRDDPVMGPFWERPVVESVEEAYGHG